MYCGPEFGEKSFEKAGGLLSFARFIDEDKILVLETDPFLSKVSKKEVIPTDALLGGEELLMRFGEHVWRLVRVLRIEK